MDIPCKTSRWGWTTHRGCKVHPWNIFFRIHWYHPKRWYIMIWNSWRCVHYYDIFWLPRKKTKKSHTGDTHVATHTHTWRYPLKSQTITLRVLYLYLSQSIPICRKLLPLLWAYHSSHSSQHMKHLRTGGSSLAATQTGAWPCAALRWLRWRWRVGPHFPHGTHRTGKI